MQGIENPQKLRDTWEAIKDLGLRTDIINDVENKIQ
jgi:hypothetical protein